MDHREFLSSLNAQDRLALTHKRDLPGLLRLSSIVLVVAVLALSIVNAVPLWPLLCLPLGIVLVFLFTLMHEATHETVFKSKSTNRIVAAICGFVLAIPPYWFLHFHLAHHRHTQDLRLDPELASPKPQHLGEYLVHLSGFRVWMSSVQTLVTNALGRCQAHFVSTTFSRRIQLEALIMCVLYAAIIALSWMAGSPLLLWIWLIPLLLGQPFLRWFLLAEHSHCEVSHDQKTNNMFSNTRTTLTNAGVRILSWNMSYHTEHHVYPTVPFHRLPELHTRLKQHLQNTSTGYRRFHQDYVARLS